MDKQCKEVIVSLAEALWDIRSGKREEVLEKLKREYVKCEDGHCRTIPEVARVVLPYAERALRDPNGEVRITGTRVIELFVPDAKYLIPKLVQVAVFDPVTEVRIAALDALGEFGPLDSRFASQVAKRYKKALTPEERSAIEDLLSNDR